MPCDAPHVVSVTVRKLSTVNPETVTIEKLSEYISPQSVVLSTEWFTNCVQGTREQT